MKTEATTPKSKGKSLSASKKTRADSTGGTEERASPLESLKSPTKNPKGAPKNFQVPTVYSRNSRPTLGIAGNKPYPNIPTFTHFHEGLKFMDVHKNSQASTTQNKTNPKTSQPQFTFDEDSQKNVKLNTLEDQFNGKQQRVLSAQYNPKRASLGSAKISGGPLDNPSLEDFLLMPVPTRAKGGRTPSNERYHSQTKSKELAENGSATKESLRPKSGTGENSTLSPTRKSQQQVNETLKGLLLTEIDTNQIRAHIQKGGPAHNGEIAVIKCNLSPKPLTKNRSLADIKKPINKGKTTASGTREHSSPTRENSSKTGKGKEIQPVGKKNSCSSAFVGSQDKPLNLDDILNSELNPEFHAPILNESPKKAFKAKMDKDLSSLDQARETAKAFKVRIYSLLYAVENNMMDEAKCKEARQLLEDYQSMKPKISIEDEKTLEKIEAAVNNRRHSLPASSNPQKAVNSNPSTLIKPQSPQTTEHQESETLSPSSKENVISPQGSRRVSSPFKIQPKLTSIYEAR